ncbi:RNA polymerase sigma factor [Chitinophaga sp. 30R24]|uniref:RNA polymerase sigma factor n=1 Tax=Chitinophaga sp. 30R24 TaxID=3248838 RepID=UPI003B8EFCF0
MGYDEVIPAFSIEAFRQGEESAFQLVFRYFFSAILFFNKSILQNDPAAAEEITEDVFIKLWQICSRFDSVSKIKAFLYIASRNACRNHIKQERRRSKKQDFLFRNSEFDTDVDHAIIKEEVLREIALAIEELPPQCRNVMMMAYLQGFKPAEIAEKMNVSLSTIRNQQARGISLLRKKLNSRQFSMLLAILQVGGF